MADQCGLEILDRFEGESSHHVWIGFTLHPDCEIEKDTSGLNSLRIVNGKIGLNLKADPGCLLTMHRGEISPMRGWFSARFMQWVPTWQLGCQARIEGTSEFRTLIDWKKNL